MAEFYDIDTATADCLLEPPTGIGGAIARCDFIDGPHGLKCVEVNFGAYLGGWQVRLLRQAYQDNASIRRFLTMERLSLPVHDPLAEMFSHVVRCTRVHLPGESSLNVALVVAASVASEDTPLAMLNREYNVLLRTVDPGLTGQILACVYPNGLVERTTRLFCQDHPVHAVIEHATDPTPPPVFRCFKAGTTTLYNGPCSRLLSNKRNLALLSQEMADSGLFTVAEAASIERYIPWTREVVAGRSFFEGAAVHLPDLLVRQQERFVLKPNEGARGDKVYVGRFTSAAEWRWQIESALAIPRSWVVQEYLPSHPHFYPDSPSTLSLRPHDVVWGAFCFGDQYGGTCVLVSPRDAHDGVVNLARGARLGIHLAG